MRSVVSAEEIGNSTLSHLPAIRTPLLFPSSRILGLRSSISVLEDKIDGSCWQNGNSSNGSRQSRTSEQSVGNRSQMRVSEEIRTGNRVPWVLEPTAARPPRTTVYRVYDKALFYAYNKTTDPSYKVGSTIASRLSRSNSNRLQD